MQIKPNTASIEELRAEDLERLAVSFKRDMLAAIPASEIQFRQIIKIQKTLLANLGISYQSVLHEINTCLTEIKEQVSSSLSILDGFSGSKTN